MTETPVAAAPEPVALAEGPEKGHVTGLRGVAGANETNSSGGLRMTSFVTDAIVSVLARFLSAAIYFFIVTPLFFLNGVLLVLANIARHAIPSGGIPYVLVNTGETLAFFIMEGDRGTAVLIPRQLLIYALVGHAILYFLFHAVAHRHANLYEPAEIVKASSVGFLLSLVYTGWLLVLLNILIAVLNSAVMPFMNIIKGFLFTKSGIPAYVTVGALLVSAHISVSLTTPIPTGLVVNFGMAVIAYLLCVLTILTLYLVASAGFVFIPVGLIQYWLRVTFHSVGGMLHDGGETRVPGIVRFSMVAVLAGGLGLAVSREFFKAAVQNIYSFARAVAKGNYGVATESMKTIVDTLYGDPETRTLMDLDKVSACDLSVDCSSVLLTAVGMGLIGFVMSLALVLSLRRAAGILSMAVPRMMDDGRQRAVEVKERVMRAVSYQWRIVRESSGHLRESVPAAVREMRARAGREITGRAGSRRPGI